MDLFLTLPTGLSQAIVKDWLNLKDLARFDEAILSRTLRTKYLELFAAPMLLHTTPLPLTYHKDRQIAFIAWIVKRGILVSSLTLPFDLNDDPILTEQFYTKVAPTLQEIVFKGRPFGPSCAQFLTHLAESCRDLQSLTLSNACQIDATFLQKLSEQCAHLHTLKLEGINKLLLTEQQLQDVHFPALSTLELNFVTTNDASLTALTQRCPHVQHLTVSKCTRLSSTAFQGIATYLSNLQSIHFGGTVLYDAVLPIVRVSGNNLTKIVLDGYHGELFGMAAITDAVVTLIAQNCTKLEHLELSGANTVTDEAVHALTRSDNCTLKHLHVNDFTAITSSAIAALQAKCPGIDVRVRLSVSRNF